MKLYLAAYAPNPRRVAMFLAEKGASEIEIEELDLAAGAQRAPAFTALNPLAQAPALVLDDGRVLTESRAICTYLESLYPEPNLMGGDGEARAFVEMWDRRVELQVSMPLMFWVRHSSPVLAAIEPRQTPDLAAYFRDQAMERLHWLEGELAQRAWIAGDRFTIADITLACGLDFAKLVRWRPGDDLPNLKRWRAALSERPAGQVKA